MPTVQIFSAGSREGGASANVAGADFHLVIGAAKAVDMTLTGSIAAGRASNWDFRPITGSGVLVSGTIETLSTVYAGSATMFFAATNDAPNDQPAAVSVTVTMTGTPLSFTPFSPIVAGDWTFALLSETVLSVSCARVNTAPLAWCSLVVQGGPVPLACTVTPASSPTAFGVQAVAANVSSVTAPAACFGPGTLVWLADGTQCAIELLRGQVSVLAVAPNGPEWEAVPVGSRACAREALTRQLQCVKWCAGALSPKTTASPWLATKTYGFLRVLARLMSASVGLFQTGSLLQDKCQRFGRTRCFSLIPCFTWCPCTNTMRNLASASAPSTMQRCCALRNCIGPAATCGFVPV